MRESTVSLSAVNVEEPSQAKSSYGSGTKNRTSAGRKPISSATVQINVKRKQTKRATATHPSSSNVKDDSDNDNGAGIGDIDPDEPTYCLCEQVWQTLLHLISLDRVAWMLLFSFRYPMER